MAYSVKEMYTTIQGEGARAGSVALFCRFSGCNLWSGREQDRERAECKFCDTDFVGTNGPGGGVFKTAADLVSTLQSVWDRESSSQVAPNIVFSGGEPLLQLNEELLRCCDQQGFTTAVETNGTLEVPEGLGWVCVSPKKPIEHLKIAQGNELKLVYPQQALPPEDFSHLNFDHFFLQPMEVGGDCYINVPTVIEYCKAHPQWRLSLQTHKMINIP